MQQTSNWFADAFEWAGRGFALLLFLFWGAFFVEHLGEWFLASGTAWPLLWVWWVQALHFGMLLALAATTVWAWPGAFATVAATAVFFATIGYRGFPFIALVNLAPLVCFAVARLFQRA
ncbi:hypothetical protein [Paludisphaera rhizosphaerae]|uniref:hypothetical protein n=1 Tax=Paludisphaera rhizosphaerae TaxID=2711216 RepID=UPI0013EB0E98|nr:hypothetical protein [Paludisphaera rhizosphaerae]